MKIERLLLILLCAGALASAGTVFSQRWQLISRWRGESKVARVDRLQGVCAPAIEKVLRTVPESGTLLLKSGFDPALLPYYLHPRRIWQTKVEPETNALCMKLPPSRYAPRDVATFEVDWLLDLRFSNADQGGYLVRHASRRTP